MTGTPNATFTVLALFNAKCKTAEEQIATYKSIQAEKGVRLYLISVLLNENFLRGYQDSVKFHDTLYYLDPTHYGSDMDRTDSFAVELSKLLHIKDTDFGILVLDNKHHIIYQGYDYKSVLHLVRRKNH